MTDKKALVNYSGSTEELAAGDNLLLQQDPVNALNAATKQYADNATLGLGLKQNQLTVGEEIFSRELPVVATVTSASGDFRLMYFTARKTETTTQVRLYSGSTAAVATPTLCRLGLYSIATNGDGTIVASTANDTSLFSVASTAYTRSWTSPYAKVAGQRYALGLIVVSGVATPTYLGITIPATLRAEHAVDQRLLGRLFSQSDLPGSFTGAQLNGTNDSRVYAVILP